MIHTGMIFCNINKDQFERGIWYGMIRATVKSLEVTQTRNLTGKISLEHG